MFVKKYFGKEYKIDDSKCSCGSDEVEYKIREVVGQRNWDANRRCEIILDATIDKAYCPNCRQEFNISLTTLT